MPKEEEIKLFIELCSTSYNEHMEHARHLETQRYQFLGFNIVFISTVLTIIFNEKLEIIRSINKLLPICIFLIIWVSLSFIITFIWNMIFEKHRIFANMYTEMMDWQPLFRQNPT